MGSPTQPLDSLPDPTTFTSRDDKIRGWLVFYIWTGFMAYVFFVSVKPALLPGDTLGMILGSLTTITIGAVGFYFQSSSGSKEKQKTP